MFALAFARQLRNVILAHLDLSQNTKDWFPFQTTLHQWGLLKCCFETESKYINVKCCVYICLFVTTHLNVIVKVSNQFDISTQGTRVVHSGI
jgi:hypothetical protein